MHRIKLCFLAAAMAILLQIWGLPAAKADPPLPTLMEELERLNAALGAGANVTDRRPVSMGLVTDAIEDRLGYRIKPIDSIDTVPSGSFAEREAASARPPRGVVLAPSFETAIPLSGVSGDALILFYGVSVDHLPGFESWPDVADLRKVELLNENKLSFAYESSPSGSGWQSLAGPVDEFGHTVSWDRAIEWGIVVIDSSSVMLSYTLLDASPDAFIASNTVAVPNRTEDGILKGSVWLLRSDLEIAAQPAGLDLKVGGSADVTVTFSPSGLVSHDLVWTGLNGVVSVGRKGSGDVYSVTGLTAGSAVLNAAASADRTVSFDLPVTVSADSSGPGPGLEPDPVETLLSPLNTALFPHKVAPLTALSAQARQAIADYGVAGPAPLSKAPAGNASFAKKTSPANELEGYVNLLPSFSASVVLSAGTTGNVLALSFASNLAGLEGFGNWKNLNDNERVLLLNTLNVVLAYEYASSWVTLVGAAPSGTTPSTATWGEALAAGIVAFAAEGLTFNYAVLDGAGGPFAAGNLLAVPDGAKDGKLNDPVWLMRRQSDTPPLVVPPTSIALSPAAVTLKEGAAATVTATVLPLGATDKTLLWSVADAAVAKIESTATADVWRVTGLAEGATVLTAAASADRAVRQTLSVTVEPKDEEEKPGGITGKSGSSGGCALSAWSLLILGFPLLRFRKNK